MELRHLRYFIAVAEAENVTRAAARLHISQPPLTRQIQELEEELGVDLFERRGKSIRLTQAGRGFLNEARACLERVEQAVAKVRTAERSVELHLGYAPSPTVEILPRLLKTLKQIDPSVRVLLHDHSSPEMLAGIRERRLHAALMMKPVDGVARGITFLKLREYPFGVAVPRDHRLAKKKAVGVEEMKDESIVAYSKKLFPDYYRFLQKRLGRTVRQLNIEQECDSGGSLVAAVESGKGIALTGSFLTAGVGHRLRFVAFDPPLDPAVVGLAYPSKGNSPALKSLVGIAETIRMSGASKNA